jgi:aerotaxis receptor
LGNEVLLDDTDLLVSQTDSRGIIIYANEIFCRVAEFNVEELIGKPHNIVRHSDMPKVAFEDLWDTVKKGKTWEGFVKNRTKTNNFYWVFATVFPYKDGFMSIRKIASKSEKEYHEKLYKELKSQQG